MYQYALRGSVQNKLAINIERNIQPSSNDEDLMQQLISMNEQATAEAEMLRDQVKTLKVKLLAAENKIEELEKSHTQQDDQQLRIGKYVVKDSCKAFLEQTEYKCHAFKCNTLLGYDCCGSLCCCSKCHDATEDHTAKQATILFCLACSQLVANAWPNCPECGVDWFAIVLL